MCDWLLKEFSEHWKFILLYITSMVTGLWAGYKYFDNRVYERRWKEFEVYYGVVEKIQNIKEEPIGLLEQIASIYELEYFGRYYSSSVRILECAKGFENFKANDSIIRAIELVTTNIKKKGKLNIK